jgi:RNA polymerase sigma factor (sigma-70 family)
MTLESETYLTQDQVASLVSRYLAGQGWALIEPAGLSNAIWESMAGKAAESAVLGQIPRRYGAILHAHCHQPDSAQYEQAWQEVKNYLDRTIGRLESHPSTQQEVIQETLIALQQAQPLQQPQAFQIVAFQTLRSRHIDWHRRQTAEKRDWRKTVPLEELGKSDEKDTYESGWEKYLRSSKGVWRTIESTVSNQEVRQQLLQFAQKHLSTDLQQMVFEAHFLDGLKPAEIAALLGKQPHEIRLVKARVINKLKSLPPPEIELLLSILGGIDSDA